MTANIILSGGDLGGAVVQIENATMDQEFIVANANYRIYSLSEFVIEGETTQTGQATFTGLA